MTQETITLPGRSNRAKWILFFVWLALIPLAATLDRSVALQVHLSHLDSAIRGKWLTAFVKFPGTFWFTLLVVGGLFAANKINMQEAVFVVFAGVMSGVNWLMKWLIGRSRPFRFPGMDQPYPFTLRPMENGILGLFSQRNLSFPSGHSCTAFALATSILLIRPRWALLFFLLATMVGAERVCENAHYLSDVVAGAGVGAIGSLVAFRVMKRKGGLDG